MEVEVKLERITKVKLPFDMRHPDDSKNYGIHGLDVWFILKGDKGAVQFMVSFGVYLPHLYPEYKNKGMKLEPKIYGFDVGYHAKVPQFDEQSQQSECDILNGPCYYDGSSLRADDWAQELFSIRGERIEEHLWRKLEQEYEDRFGPN